MDKKEFFEDMYREVLVDNDEYKNLVIKGNMLDRELEKYSGYEEVTGTYSEKEFLVFQELSNFLNSTANIFIEVHKIKNKRFRAIIIKGLKKCFDKTEMRFRKKNKEYLTELDNYVNAYVKLTDSLTKEEDKKLCTELLDAEGDRHLLERDLLFDVMLTIGRFLKETDKLKGFENNINDADKQPNIIKSKS